MNKTIIIKIKDVPKRFSLKNKAILLSNNDDTNFIYPEFKEIHVPTKKQWLKILYDEILLKQIHPGSELAKRITKSLSEMIYDDVKWTLNKLFH
jgi:hypothetical protein